MPAIVLELSCLVLSTGIWRYCTLGSCFSPVFLLIVGFALLGSYSLLGKVYWFSVPFTSILVAFACYAIGVIAGLTNHSSGSA
jgi:hypothetical protein